MRCSPSPSPTRASRRSARRSTKAADHLRTILYWGFVVGLALGFATMVSQRWGKFWFALSLGIVVG